MALRKTVGSGGKGFYRETTLCSLVTTTQMKSPGIYSFHELRRFSAMMSPGMMIGASDLSLLKQQKFAQK